MKNKIIYWGFLGMFDCYLNLSEEEAIARYIKENPDYTAEEARGCMNVLEFDDQFGAYEIWEA